MKHFAIFLSAISVLLLSGCQEKIEKGKKEAWNRTVDTVAGKYSLTDISAGGVNSYDLDGNGVADPDIMTEFKGLANYEANSSTYYARVTRADTYYKSGDIGITFPIQGLSIYQGRLVPAWIFGDIALTHTTYTADFYGGIQTQDQMGLGQNEENDDLLDRCTMTDLHFSFPEPETLELDVSWHLHDFITERLHRQHLTYTFTRYETYYEE